MGVVPRAEQYIRYAEKCVALAKRAPNAADKALLLDMAEKWRALAQSSESAAADHSDTDKED